MAASERIKISRAWRFHAGPVPGAEAAGFDDGAWRTLDVPHDWSIEGAFEESNFRPGFMEDGLWISRADSYLPRGTGWYRKWLDVPQRFRDQQTYIEFEGVFRNSTLWVNGHRAGTHPSGYTGCVYSITPFLNTDGARNVLALEVDAERSEGWWYEGAGLYRHVWCLSKPAVHVPPWSLRVTTPAVSFTAATVQVRAVVHNASARRAGYVVRTTLLDPRGAVVASMESRHSLEPGAQGAVLQEAVLENPSLWSPERPALHTARIDVASGDGEEAVDRLETPFGIRWFEFTPDRGFFLNGRSLQLRGGCIHHDFGGLGVALPDRAHAKNVEVLKAMGANFLRLSHNPAAPALLDACDRLGMLVWAETRTLDVRHGAREALQALIERDANHPSIVVWSLANTAGDPDGERSTGFLRELNELAHRLDPTRPTAVALEGNADPSANGFAEVTDVVGYNGGGMSIDDRDHRLHPQRRMLISEYSSGRGARGVYREEQPGRTELEAFGDGRLLKRGGQLCSTYDLCLSHEKGTAHFAEGWMHVEARPWLAGGCMWSAIEYRGETTGWPVVTSQFGVLDLCRFPKDAYYFYQSRWTDTPVFHVFPHWTWPGREGELIEVWCYRNCCELVDLYVNGKRVAGQEPHHIQYQTNRPHLIWKVPYEPGVLVAEGLTRDGRRVCRREIRTAGAAAGVRARADRSRLAADGEDVAFLTLGIHDAAGTLVPHADASVSVEVAGAGRLLGMGSGDPAGHESEKAGRIRCFNGLALAVVQSDGRPGPIEVRVFSPGLEPCTLELTAEG